MDLIFSADIYSSREKQTINPRGKKTGVCTYSSDQGNEIGTIFNLSLDSNRQEEI